MSHSTINSQSMHRCNCSTNALERLITDLAGISIRQQRAQIFFQHYRTFSSRPLLRRPEATHIANQDDRSIPFELDASKVSVYREAGAGEISRNSDRISEETEDEEWHAEVEIVSPGVQAGLAKESVELPNDFVTESRGDLESGQDVSPVHHTVLELPAISRHIPALGLSEKEKREMPRTKAERRQAKKIKYKEEGIYKANMKKHREGGVAETSEKEEGSQEKKEPSLEDSGKRKTGDKVEVKAGRTRKEVRRQRTGRKTVGAHTTHRNIKAKSRQDTSNIGHKASGAEPTRVDTTKLRSETARSKAKSKGKPDANTTQGSSSDTAEEPQNSKLRTTREIWMIQKQALKDKFGEQTWQPRKKLSPDTMGGIRALHASDPGMYSTAMLTDHFKVSAENIRRILKSKWQPKPEEIEKRNQRWEKRGLEKWEAMAEQGVKPPRKWRDMGVGNPDQHRKIERKAERKKHGDPSKKSKWDKIAETADRLPMEGSFAERIM